MPSLAPPPPNAKSVNGKYDYDYVVIGGGSGGLAAAKQAMKADPKLKVACFDFVKPSPAGTKWGLGGTCVNVGCIPKKLFHYTGLMHGMFADAKALGWQLEDTKHDWKKMVKTVDTYIKSLNFNYKKELGEAPVDYINAYAAFTDPHTIEYEEKGEKKTLTADKFLVVVGGRPKYPDIPGWELGISSDDIFWKVKSVPGKTLVVGASYIALECAGFLHELGYDTTVMVRSILLRGFDQQAANQVGEIMERNGIRFVRPATPTKLEKKGEKILVTWLNEDSKKSESEEFDTVLYAIGRDAVINTIGLDKAGVKVNHGKIVTNDADQTNVPHIYAIGDCALNRPELTPVAIKAGQLLSDRLFKKGAKRLMDYAYVPTVVFTPMEYGCVGLSQEDAEAKLGKDNVITYLTRYGYLEQACTDKEKLPKPRSFHFHEEFLWARQHAKKMNKPLEEFKKDSFEWEEDFRQYIKQNMLAKLVCEKKTGRVVGFHYIGPNAGEVTQGYALAVKLGAKKEDFDNLVGIHPTSAEEFTSLSETLQSGEDFMKKGGC